MKKEHFLRIAYKIQAILVDLIRARYSLDNADEDTAIIRSEMDDAIRSLACAAKSLAERGIFGSEEDATDINVDGKEEDARQ